MLALRQGESTDAELDYPYRICAVGLGFSGFVGLFGSLNVAALAPGQQLAGFCASAVLLFGGTWGARRPELVRAAVHNAPALVIAAVLVLLVASTALLSGAFNPLYMACLIGGAVVGALLPSWAVSAPLYALLYLGAVVLSGQLPTLGQQQSVGFVLVATPVAMINATWIGVLLWRINRRLRALNAVADREGRRFQTLQHQFEQVRSHSRAAARLTDEVKLFASTLPADERARALAAVAQSRKLAEQDAAAASGPTLLATVNALVSSYRGYLSPDTNVTVDIDEDLEVPLAARTALETAARQMLDNAGRETRLTEVSVRAVREHDAVSVVLRTAPATSAQSGKGGQGYELAVEAVNRLGPSASFRWGPANDGWIMQVRLPLDDHETGALVDHAALVRRWIGEGLRVLRISAGLMMISVSLIDLQRDAGWAFMWSVAAVVTAEFAMSKARLRTRDHAGLGWALVAAGIVILASGLIPQEAHYQTNGWAASTFIEIAWRGGWLVWATVEALRIVAVTLTWVVPEGELFRAISAQVIFPLGVGFGAVASHALMERIETAQRRVGSEAERWSLLISLSDRLAESHNVISPLQNALRGHPGPLLDATYDLAQKMKQTTNKINAILPSSQRFASTIEGAFADVAEVPVELIGFEAISVPGGEFDGASAASHGKRSRLLAMLTEIAEREVQEASGRDCIGRPRLVRVFASASQDDDGAVTIDVTATPALVPAREDSGRSSWGETSVTWENQTLRLFIPEVALA